MKKCLLDSNKCSRRKQQHFLHELTTRPNQLLVEQLRLIKVFAVFALVESMENILHWNVVLDYVSQRVINFTLEVTYDLSPARWFSIRRVDWIRSDIEYWFILATSSKKSSKESRGATWNNKNGRKKKKSNVTTSCLLQVIVSKCWPWQQTYPPAVWFSRRGPEKDLIDNKQRKRNTWARGRKREMRQHFHHRRRTSHVAQAKLSCGRALCHSVVLHSGSYWFSARSNKSQNQNTVNKLW